MLGLFTNENKIKKKLSFCFRVKSDYTEKVNRVRKTLCNTHELYDQNVGKN